MEIEVSRDLQPLMTRFLENRSSEILKARESLKNGDYQGLHRFGHSLKGVCLGYGVHAMVPLADEVQSAALARSDTQLLRLLEAIHSFFRDVSIRYK